MNYLDPYHKIGLRRNPFIAPDLLEIPRQKWLDFGFSKPLIQPNLFIQIMGEKGAGKTSHLLHWQQQTEGIYYYCPQGRLRWQFPPIAQISYWDEADRIPYIVLLISLAKIRYSQGTVIVGTHQNLTLLAHLLGFRVHQIQLSTLTVQNLERWIHKLLDVERLCPDIPITLDIASIDTQDIVAKSNGSWRSAASYLHIWLSQQTKL